MLLVSRFENKIAYDLPCELINPKIHLQTKAQFQTMNQTLTFNLPSIVTSTTLKYSYSFESFVAEFGSWLGFFTGMAIIQVNDFIKFLY